MPLTAYEQEPLYGLDKITKMCSACGEFFPLWNFYRDLHNRDGLKYQCADCYYYKGKGGQGHAHRGSSEDVRHSRGVRGAPFGRGGMRDLRLGRPARSASEAQREVA